MKSRSENQTLQQPQAHAAEPVLKFMKYTYIIWPCLCWSQYLPSPFDLRSRTLCQEIFLPALFFSIPLVCFKTRGWMELIFNSQHSACCFIFSSSYGERFFLNLPAFIWGTPVLISVLLLTEVTFIYLSSCVHFHYFSVQLFLFHPSFLLFQTGFKLFNPQFSIFSGVLRRKVRWMRFCSPRV